MTSFVYFIRPAGMLGPVKIGCSALPEKRLAGLMVWSPFPLEIAATVAGGLKLERNIHECFADAHSHNEWFRPVGRLVGLIQALQAGIELSAAIDLTKRVGSIRKPRARGWSPDRRRYISYTHKMRHAIRKVDTPDKRLFEPEDTAEIMSRWSRGRSPSQTEFQRLDQVILAPKQHAVTREARFPDRGAWKFVPQNSIIVPRAPADAPAPASEGVAV